MNPKTVEPTDEREWELRDEDLERTGACRATCAWGAPRPRDSRAASYVVNGRTAGT